MTGAKDDAVSGVINGHLNSVRGVRNHMSDLLSKSTVLHVLAARYTFTTCGSRNSTCDMTMLLSQRCDLLREDMRSSYR